MKKLITICLIPVLLACMLTASAGGAGSKDDPIVSLSYIDSVFYNKLIGDGASFIDEKLAATRSDAVSRLDEIYRDYAGYGIAPQFTEIGLAAGNRVNIAFGASFTLTEGSAVLTVTRGSVINVTTGFEAISGAVLELNQRYFCTEETNAVITASVDSLGFVDGLYTTDGKLNPNKPVFIDTRKSDWFYTAVEYVYSHGLFAGTSENTFTPSGSMTRAMFVTVLHRMAGTPPPGVHAAFTDVSDAGEYFYAPVLWASETGVVAGYDDGTFLPGNSITREQMALIMYRYAVFKGFDITFNGESFNTFPDHADISDYAYDAMIWAVSNGIINGSDGFLLPKGTATRAQVAQIIYNYSTNMTEPITEHYNQSQEQPQVFG